LSAGRLPAGLISSIRARAGGSDSRSKPDIVGPLRARDLMQIKPQSCNGVSSETVNVLTLFVLLWQP
jgi:hypothetical protein